MSRIFLPVILLAACDDPTATNNTGANTATDVASRVSEGTATAQGMIAFLNDANTTFDLLDIDVALDVRAAESIIDWRSGPDHVDGTTDDRTYTTVQQVDDRYYVGNAALARIQNWAETHDWVPTDADHLGTWDSVSFTVAEAEAVIELANTAGSSYLDDDLSLDSRAVESILDARPISTVYDLSGLYYVGTSALETLKEDAIGEPGCETPGWETSYVYDEGDDAWRDQVPEELEALIESVLQTDDWCGEATSEPWFVKATIDRFECEEKGYTIELGQYMLEYPEISWYIEFEVDGEFGYNYAVCEV